TMYTKFSGHPDEHAKDQKAIEENPKDVQIVGGIVREITERLLETNIGLGSSGTFGSYVFTSSENFKGLLFQMMKEAKVKLRLHSWVVDVIQEKDTIKGVVLESKSGRQFVPAKQFVDTTGDGDLAAQAGVPFTIGVTKDDICAKKTNIGDMTNPGVMFKLGNVDLNRTFAWLTESPECFGMQGFARFSLEEAKERYEKGEMSTMIVRANKVPDWFQIYNQPDEGVVTLCCPCVKDIDGCDSDQLTRAEVIIADMVNRWVTTIKKLPGFEKAFLLNCPEIGVRETRHIQGDYVLNLMDIYEGKDFKDSIGLGSHPIDTYPRPAWLNDPETAYPPRWYFKIPYRSLVAKGKENLLIAGRCISATHEAFGCIRPTVQCMITGEAAGTAAALCIQEKTIPRALDIDLLQKTLKNREVLL
ncbi:MAG: FAD-dependent oxidoreductase, partial [Victivallales bacterium]|nr:FAD-dependent oxidoreductase [Victivallales bacterium]